MSQMIDGARDEYDSLDPLVGGETAPNGAMRRRGSSHLIEHDFAERSSRRPDEADDPFFDDAFDTAPKRAAPPLPTERPARGRGERAKRQSGVWLWALVATLVWIGAVIGFSAGMLRMPLQPIGGLVTQLAALDPRMQMMILAIAVAPLGLIVQTALMARRGQNIASETKLLRDRLETYGGALNSGAAVNASAELRQEAEATARAINALEAGFEAAEERAQLARNRLETERSALAKMIGAMDADVARISQSLAALPSSSNGDARASASEFAQMIAAALSENPTTGHMAQRVSPAVASSSIERTASERDLVNRRPALSDSPGDKVRQMAEAAKQSLAGVGIGAGDDYTPPRRQAETATDNEDGDFDDFDDDYDYEDEGGYDNDTPLAPEIETPPPAAAPAEPRQPLDWSKLIRAANFPDSEDDRETLDALYAVLSDKEAASLLQSAEDALSSLADLGLFMEDMQPHHAPVEVWRAFIVEGANDGVMDLGGIRDPHAIEDVSSAIGEKPEFDNTAKRFIERYETVLARIFAEAPSPRMAVELADTRSGRAYMLIGRAMGRFG